MNMALTFCLKVNYGGQAKNIPQNVNFAGK